MIIRQLGSGKFSDCFKVSNASGRPCVAAKLSYYQEATIRAYAHHAHLGNVTAAHTAKDQDAISVAMAMAEVAKQMLLHGVSPHFVKVFCEADVRNLPKKLKPLLPHRQLTAQQCKYSHVCIMELYSCNLTDFISRHRPLDDVVLKTLIFQVLYTLACLQKLFPGFRHNDLSSNNVLVKPAPPECTRYAFADMHPVYTSAPFFAALADFDFTHVPNHDVLSNERVLNGKYKIQSHPNNSYDTHLFLNSLYRCLKRRRTQSLCPQTWHFMAGLQLGNYAERLDVHIPHLVPRCVLSHQYFASLRQFVPPSAQFSLPA